MRAVAVVAAVVLAFAVAGSLVDSRLDFPGVSPLVCSLHHGLWYNGGLLGAPGCYPQP